MSGPRDYTVVLYKQTEISVYMQMCSLLIIEYLLLATLQKIRTEGVMWFIINIKGIYHPTGTCNLESSAGEIKIQFSTTW